MLGFWHCLGVHAGETREDILRRKEKEIEANEWTLWSFQDRKEEFIRQWINYINANPQPQPIYAFCSDSPEAKDPGGVQAKATQYKSVDDQEWQSIPSTVEIPHPFGKKKRATAFKVVEVIHPVLQELKGIKVEWLYKNGSWRKDTIPTRGEYLIRSGGEKTLRKTYALLKLDPPYIVQIEK